MRQDDIEIVEVGELVYVHARWHQILGKVTEETYGGAFRVDYISEAGAGVYSPWRLSRAYPDYVWGTL